MDAALKTMIDNMPEKTGKSLEQWKAILKENAFEKHGQAVSFLKKEHQVTHGYANTIVTLSKDSELESVDLVATQYKGKESLMPIYKKLIDIVAMFGDDVTITPKKASVSVIRKTTVCVNQTCHQNQNRSRVKAKGHSYHRPPRKLWAVWYHVHTSRAHKRNR